MDLNLTKWANIGSPNQAKLQPTIFKAYIQAQRIMHKGKHFSILSQNEPYIYLGLQLVASSKWQIQKNITMSKAKEKCKLLIAPLSTIRPKI